jgi:hypothetical protein
MRQCRLLFRAAHDPKAPGLAIVRRRRAAGGFDEARQGLGGYRLWQKATNRLSLQDRRQRPVERALGLV